MRQNSNLTFGKYLRKALTKAQTRAENMHRCRITDILILYELICNSDTFICQFLKQAKISIKEARTVAKRLVKKWAKEGQTVDEDESELWELEDIEVRFDVISSKIMDNAFNYSNSDCYLDELSFLLSLTDKYSKYVDKFFTELKISRLLYERYFEGVEAENVEKFMKEAEGGEQFEDELGEYIPELSYGKEKSASAIFKKLSGILTEIKAEVSEQSPILGRDLEKKRLEQALLKSKKSNAILVGEAGVGKTALMEHLAWCIKNKKCAPKLEGKKIVSLNTSSLIAGTIYRGMAEARFELVKKYLEKEKDVILFIDEIHTVLGAGSTTDGNIDFANSLKPILAREGISVVGATTNTEYEVFKYDPAFKRRFEVIEIEEPEFSEVQQMIANQVKKMEKFHNVKITEDNVNFLIKISSCFNAETSNPDRSIDLIDKTLATATMLGKKEVDKQVIDSTLDGNIKLFEEMTVEEKRRVAFHEAGHYLVGKYVKANRQNALAVSIMPVGNALGLTSFESPKCYKDDYSSLVNDIATLLGGRTAEKMHSGKDSAGACGDLKEATELARKMVVEFGLKGFKRRNADQDYEPSKIKEVNKEVDQIIEEGYKIAGTILKEKRKLLDKLAETLVEKGYLVDTELEKICNEFEKEGDNEIKKPNAYV